jgi:4-hydroxybenzoate polyprenyltransferase
LARVKLFLELVRFSHTIFALPFALLSAAMALWDRTAVYYEVDAAIGSMFPTKTKSHAEESADVVSWVNSHWWHDWQWREVLGIVLCMVFARSAAMAFNRLVDAKFDVDNPRTAKRHIPAGLVSRKTVALWTALCAAGFIASTLLFLPNRWPLYLSVPFLVFICSYSLTKRFTSLAHFWLGASLMLAPIAAWIAILGRLAFKMPWPPLVLGSAVLLWVAGFDIIYATQDVDVDRKLRLRSVPARFGVAGALRIAALCHLGMLALLFALPSVFPAFGTLWYVGAAAVAVLLVYEHSIVKPDDLTRVNAAFFNCNAVVSLGLLVVGVCDLLI